MLARWRRAPEARPCSVHSAARSHVGRVRSINEDRLLDRPDRRLWAVADGMGGHSAGDLAAETAIAALAALADSPDPITRSGMTDALTAASERIAAGRAPGTTSGTTIVAMHLDAGRAVILWAGDSRCYHLRDGRGTQLTRDHSLVQSLVDAGLLASADADRHPRAHVITRALGVEGAVPIDAIEVEVRPGDRLLLCSDGASRSLCERDFGLSGSLDEGADRLLANALQRDGSDNVSLLLVAIGADG